MLQPLAVQYAGARIPDALPESLSPRQLSLAVEAERPLLQRCYDDWLRQHPLRASAVFELSAELIIAPDGHTESAQLAGIDDQPKLASCILEVLHSWHFPRSRLGAELIAPLLLAGRARADALSPRALHQIARSNKSSLSRCFEQLAGDRPKLVASLNINPDGSTRSAQLRGAEQLPALKTCLRNVLLAWHFPRLDKPVEYAFPL